MMGESSEFWKVIAPKKIRAMIKSSVYATAFIAVS